MSHPVNWFQIRGQDAGALHKFYTDVFRWKLMASPDPSMMFVEKEKGGISGGIADGQGSAGVSVYVACEDVDLQLAKVEAAGGKTTMSKVELPSGMGFIAGFTDPAGNFIGLWAPAPKSSAKKADKKEQKKAAKKDRKAAARKADKKPEKKADKKPEKKADKKPEKKADKKPEKKKGTKKSA
jgi:predicted enzyme related to lactoylglutathione lyase